MKNIETIKAELKQVKYYYYVYELFVGKSGSRLIPPDYIVALVNEYSQRIFCAPIRLRMAFDNLYRLSKSQKQKALLKKVWNPPSPRLRWTGKGVGGEAVGLSCLQYLAARYSCQLHRSRRSAFPQKVFSSPPETFPPYISYESMTWPPVTGTAWPVSYCCSTT